MFSFRRTFQLLNPLGNNKFITPGFDKFVCSAVKKPAERMTELLRLKFPEARVIEVKDVSGGCGSMYEIFVESIEFTGMSTVKQHKLIFETLKEDIQQMHGLRLLTRIPDPTCVKCK